METVIYYLLSAIAALIALTVHEYCHGYAAYKLGDDTAKSFGRLTLNPIKHLDPYGAICMVLFHIGWAKPVPINARNFKNPKRDFAITAAAGPASNLILGFVSALIYLVVFVCVKDMTFPSANFTYHLINNLLNFIYVFHSINVGLGLFNLLPIPPFDGSRLLNVFLPEKIYFEIMKYERYIYYGVLAWLFLGHYVTDLLRSIPIIASNSVLYFVSGIFSLSGVLSNVIGGVSNLMFSFWELFPFL